MRSRRLQPGPMPPLTWLRAFEAAARHASFKLAAEELCVTPTAISQHIRSLEAFYSVKLFTRQTRAVELTRLGKLAAIPVSEAIEKFADACDILGSDTDREWVTVTAPFTFCMKWLMPHLERFNQDFPGLEIRINATDDVIDLNQGDADIGIRYGSGSYPDLESQKLIDDVYCVVASPDLFRDDERPTLPSALSQYRLLHTDWQGSSEYVPNWDMWLLAAGVSATSLDSLSKHTFSNEMMTIRAAASGLGIALVSHANAIKDLNAGRLIRVLEHTPNIGRFDYYIVRPKSGYGSHSATTLHAWLLETAQQEGCGNPLIPTQS